MDAKTCLFFAMAFVSFSILAQEKINLQQAVDEALAQGEDNKALLAKLEASRSLHFQNLAKNNFTISATGGYSVSDTITNPEPTAVTPGIAGLQAVAISPKLVSTKLNNLLMPHVLNEQVTLGNLQTKGSVTASQGFQLNQDLSWSQAMVLGASVTHTLWDGYPGGMFRATVDKSALSLKAAELADYSSRLALILQVKRAYYMALQAQENIPLLEGILAQRVTFLKLVQMKYELNQASTIDLKTSQINKSSAEINLLNGKRALKTALKRLAVLTGRTNITFVLTKEPDPNLLAQDQNEAVQKGLAQRVDLKQLELNISSAQIDINVAWGASQPKISLNAGVNWAQYFTQDTGSYVFSLTGNVSLPVIDAGLSKEQTQQSRQLIFSYESQKKSLKETITVDIEDAFESCEIFQQQYSLAVFTQEQMQIQQEITRIQYENGTADLNDVMISDVNFSNAVFNQINAKNNLQLAILQLQSAMGF